MVKGIVFLSLKENLRAVEARNAHMKQEQEQREEQEQDEILMEGLNPDEVLTKRKRIRQFEKDKEWVVFRPSDIHI